MREMYWAELEYRNRRRASEQTIQASWFDKLVDYLDEKDIESVYEVGYGVGELLYNIRLKYKCKVGGCDTLVHSKKYAESKVEAELDESLFDPSIKRECVIFDSMGQPLAESVLELIKSANADFILVVNDGNDLTILKETEVEKPKKEKKPRKKKENIIRTQPLRVDSVRDETNGEFIGIDKGTFEYNAETIMEVKDGKINILSIKQTPVDYPDEYPDKDDATQNGQDIT